MTSDKSKKILESWTSGFYVVLESFVSAPLLIEESQMPRILESLRYVSQHMDLFHVDTDEKAEADADYWPSDPDSYEARKKPYNVANGVLQIPVRGTLLNRFDYQIGSYATGYQYIRRALERGLEDSEVNGIALVSDSPGGHAAGAFELTDQIFEARGEKPIRAFAAEYAMSAAYSLASAASEVRVTPSAEAGSVGVVRMHIDVSDFLSELGVKPTFVFAGKHKVDGNMFSPLSKEVKSDWQDGIDKTYGEFTTRVARNRGMSQDAVRDTEAQIYDARDSVGIGFADGIETLEKGLSEFSDSVSQNSARGSMMENETGAATLTQADVDKAASEAATKARADAVSAERKRSADVLASTEYAGREKLAQTLLSTTELSSEQIIAAITDAPKPGAAAAPAKDHFREAMNAEGTPGIESEEADPDPDAEEPTLDAKVDRVFGNAGHAPAAA